MGAFPSSPALTSPPSASWTLRLGAGGASGERDFGVGYTEVKSGSRHNTQPLRLNPQQHIGPRMDSQPKHGLKIADTPTEDEAAEAGDSTNTVSPSPPAPTEFRSSQQSLWPEDDQLKKRPGKTKRLTPKEIVEELDRVSRLNGVPTLARDTCQDD
jgi:hypothetical protein